MENYKGNHTVYSKCNVSELRQLSNTNSIPNDKTLRNISKETLITNKVIICGKQVKVPFPGLGNFVCKIEKYNPASDTYTLIRTVIGPMT